MVTRLTPQKGIDLVLRVIHEIMQENVAFILLGTGDADYEIASGSWKSSTKDVCALISVIITLWHIRSMRVPICF